MRTLESRYPVEDWSRGMTSFEILISTILSQSTTVANERRGFNDLRSRVGAITPERVAQTPEAEIAAAFVGDGRALRQDRRDEDLERRHPAAPILDRVPGLESPHRAGEGATVHALERGDGRKGCVTRSQRSGSS